MCNCNDEVNKLLAKDNTRLLLPLLLNKNSMQAITSKLKIVTEKLDSNKRGKPVNIFASYCPFCGEGYE